MPQEVTVLYSMAKYTQDLERERETERYMYHVHLGLVECSIKECYRGYR